MMEQEDYETTNLKAEIQDYDRRLQKNPACHLAYSLKAEALTKLIKWTKAGDYGQVLECLNKAVELSDSRVSDYLVDRGEVHAILGMYEKAIFDLKAASALPRLPDSRGSYVQNKIKEVVTLIQKSIADSSSAAASAAPSPKLDDSAESSGDHKSDPSSNLIDPSETEMMGEPSNDGD